MALGLVVLGAIVYGLFMPQKALAFSGQGNGTTQYPYRITTCLQLQEMNNAPSAHYVLMDNINCADGGTGNDTNTWNGGEGFVPVGVSTTFTGTLDGRAFNISDLVINRPTEDYVGLFGKTNGASNPLLGTFLSLQRQ